MNKLLAILLLVFGCACAHAQSGLSEIALAINGHKLTAEVAATDDSRSTGLMHRRMMPENRGMLFVFGYAAVQNFWMMNTHIPLSIAFIDDSGAIINIADMKPLTTDPHPSARPARFALEMNQGWFAKRGIKAGAKIEGLERSPAPQ